MRTLAVTIVGDCVVNSVDERVDDNCAYRYRNCKCRPTGVDNCQRLPPDIKLGLNRIRESHSRRVAHLCVPSIEPERPERGVGPKTCMNLVVCNEIVQCMRSCECVCTCKQWPSCSRQVSADILWKVTRYLKAHRQQAMLSAGHASFGFLQSI